MFLFSLEKFNYLARPLKRAAKLKAGIFWTRRFANNELFITIKNKIAGQNCYLLGTFAPPDENLLSLLLLSHTLKKEKARQVTALVPYLGYGRQDKDEKNKSLGLAWLGNLLSASGLNKIITVDIHNPRRLALLKVPVISLSSAGIFAAALKKDKVKFDCILAPDHGALARCQLLKKTLKSGTPVIFCQKTRLPDGVYVSGIKGNFKGPRVLIHDDILDTGGTLVAACKAARRAGAKEIIIAVTHGLFTGTKWKQLWRLGIKQIYTTNSLPSATAQTNKKIKIISLVSLLSTYFKDA